MKRLLALAMVMTLAGCGTVSGPPSIQVKTVDIPMPVACVPGNWTPAPKHISAADLLAAKDAAERYRQLAQFWLIFGPYVDRDEAVISACIQAAPAPK